MADLDREQLLRLPGLTFRAAGPVLGTGVIAESALRLLELDSGQRHRGNHQLFVVQRVTYFAREALSIRNHYPNISHQSVAYQKLLAHIVSIDKTAHHEHAAKGLTMRQAVIRIVDNYRVARHHYILHADEIDSPVPVARENETKAAFLDRQRLDFALREMWGVLDQLQDLMTVRGRAALASKQALAQEIKARTVLQQQIGLYENDADIQKKEHLASREKAKIAEAQVLMLQKEHLASRDRVKTAEDQVLMLQKEIEKLKKENQVLKKNVVEVISDAEHPKGGGVSKDVIDELEAIPQ